MTSNAFPILRLPSLAFQTVFEQFEFFEVLLFSMCSNAAKNLSKVFKAEKLPCNLTIASNGGAELNFYRRKFIKETLMQDYQQRYDSRETVYPQCTDNIKFIRTVEHGFCFTHEPGKVKEFETTEYKVSWESVGNELKRWIKNMVEVFNVSIGTLDWNNNNENLCEWFLKESSVKITKINFNAEVSPEMALLRMDGFLELWQSRLFTLPHLITASGKFHTIELTNSSLSDQDLNMFIKEWISGSSDMKELEYLRVRRSTEDLKMLERQIIDGITVERYEEYEDRVFVPKFTPQDRFFYEDGFSFGFGLDIKNKDGEKGTILMDLSPYSPEEGREMRFLVWK